MYQRTEIRQRNANTNVGENEVVRRMKEKKQTTRVCKKCNREVLRSELEKNGDVCPYCGSYLRVHAYKRISRLADKNSFIEWDGNIRITVDKENVSYRNKLESSQNKHGLREAVVTGTIKIAGIETAIGVMDTRFLMASMGHVVGEKITKLFERATKKKVPVILFCCSGGARMQEGIISLMQMEKTAAAVNRHDEAGLLYVSVLTNPTMGGVTASFAMLADIILAEKEAMVGFAGSRVIEQNTDEKEEVNFQTAEFQLEHGFVDGIVTRQNTRKQLEEILQMHVKCKKCFKDIYKNKSKDASNIATELNSWERVKIARNYKRPISSDYIAKVFEDFIELKGDRVGNDDHTIIAGLAKFNGFPVTVVGQQKGKKTLEEAIYYNWGMASPSGYRKALRLMKQAEKFGRPIVCFVDTIGAACGKDAEENGQSIAIAQMLKEMSVLQVPVLSVIIGEGSSGGALAMGVGDEVWMLENAVYSILTPEGYASIIWRDNERAKDAAEVMSMDAESLYEMQVIDKIIYEGAPATVDDMDEVSENLKREISRFLAQYSGKKGKKLVNERYNRFRKF